MEQRTVRPRIADVAREAGVSKTAVSFAFNSPERLAPETAEPDPRRRRAARLHGPPGRPDAQPARDADDRRAHPAGRSRSSSRTRSSARSARASRSRPRSPATRSTSSRRCAASLAGAMGRATVDGVVAIGLSRDHPRSSRSGAPASRSSSSTRPPCRTTARSTSTTRAARGRPRSTSSRSAIATSLVMGVEGRRRRLVASSPDGVTNRRLLGYREAFGAVGVGDPATTTSSPARRASTVAAPPSPRGGAPACGRRPSWR